MFIAPALVYPATSVSAGPDVNARRAAQIIAAASPCFVITIANKQTLLLSSPLTSSAPTGLAFKLNFIDN